jgi:hypothetical protein
MTAGTAALIRAGILGLALIALGVPARGGGTGGLVTVVAPGPVSVRSGETTTVVLPIAIAAGYHVQANPAGTPFLVPLAVDLELAGADTTVSWRVAYPAPDTLRLDGDDAAYPTYHGDIAVEVLTWALRSAVPGERSFTGSLRYQACDRRRCFPPASVPLAFTVRVADE